MPANLNHRFLNAEKAYRRATSLAEEFECLQVMLREIPKHKGTDKLQAELKKKISKTRESLEAANKSTGRSGFKLPRQGAGRVVIIGAANSGKSQLLSTLTNATPEIAPYPFTTREPIPGMMKWEDVSIQVVDTAPISADHYTEETHALIRSADLVLLLLDLGSDDGADDLLQVLTRTQNSKTRLGPESTFDPNDIGVTYTKTILASSKADDVGSSDRREFFEEVFVSSPFEIPFQEFPISATTGSGISTLSEQIFTALDVVRVYTKDPRKKTPDFDKPYAVRRGTELIDVAKLIHEDLAKNFRSAKVWGANVHDATAVTGDYLVSDKDVVEILCK